jgi:hypothetical protein
VNASARPPRRSSPVLDALARVDWPRAIHRASGFVRALRGDPDVVEDAAAEVERGRNTHKLIDRLARAAVGCNERADCPCPICEERRGERP